jgi:hypothetical protein
VQPAVEMPVVVVALSLVQVQVCVAVEPVQLSEYECDPRVALQLHVTVPRLTGPPPPQPLGEGVGELDPELDPEDPELPPAHAGPVACEKHSTPPSTERQHTSGEPGERGCQLVGHT